MTTVLTDPVRTTIAAVAADAAHVDEAEVDLRPRLREVLTGGGLHRGAAGVAAQAEVLAQLARECMATAFSLWGHRMALEYLDRFGGPEQAPSLAALADGSRPGVSAMAASFRRLAHQTVGAEPTPLGVTARREGTDLVLDGFLPYATNLHEDAVLVLGVELGEGRDGAAVLALDLATPGIEVRPATDLLALGSTRSGSLRLTGARVPDSAVLPTPFTELVGGSRATFLTLQSAFCLGHARGSLASFDATGTAFADEAQTLADEQARLGAQLRALAENAYDGAAQVAYLRLRLATMDSAQHSAQLALCVTGGRGYTRTHPVARRLRESAFLPVQAPTKGQLLWELQSLSSTA